MKISGSFVFLGFAVGAARGVNLSHDPKLEAVEIARRALPNSPKGYVPSTVQCPENVPSVRSADSVSRNETEWIRKRRVNTVQPMKDLLTRLNIEGFDTGSYIDQYSRNISALPNIGIAFSGGGWRALLNGAGVLKAFDSRTENSTNPGHVGGLLQSSTYIAGLSGGNWLVGSMYMNNFSTVNDLQTDVTGAIWEFGRSVIQGPEKRGFQILDTAQYYASLVDDVVNKQDAGFNVSVTDYWGRALSFQLINAPNGGDAYTWSSIALSDYFQKAEVPFPVVVADGRAPGQKIISLNSNVYEFSPFEMGSWDPDVYGFVPTQYLGTEMRNGFVSNQSQCTVGFDNAGFVMGTSSSLFNQLILNFNDTSMDISDTLRSTVNAVLTSLDQSENDIADYSPNPFRGWKNDTNPNANSNRLTLVDGGEDLQNIPLHPLIQPERGVDVIFAIDSSADVNNWPNATAMVATYQRSLANIANGTGFPSVPDQNTFVNLGLNSHPTFFGCNTSNITSGQRNGLEVPLVVYLPNSPYVTYSNMPTFTLSTNNTYRDAIISNGYHVATMGNSTIESTWPTCVACAILSRSFERTRTQVPDACTSCFERFCWNGTVDSRTPESPYNPTTLITTFDLASNHGICLDVRLWTSISVAMAIIFILVT